MQILTYISAVDFLVLEHVRLNFFPDKIFCNEDGEKTDIIRFGSQPTYQPVLLWVNNFEVNFHVLVS